MSKPYYSQAYAEDTRKLLDILMSTPSRQLLVAHKDLNVTRESLRTRLFNSALYLKERLDPEGKYAKILAFVTISADKHGILLTHKEGVKHSVADVAIDTGKIVKSLPQEVLDFLEESKQGHTFERDNLALTEVDIQALEALLAPLSDDFIWNVSKQRVRIVKHRTRREPGVELASKEEPLG